MNRFPEKHISRGAFSARSCLAVTLLGLALFPSTLALGQANPPAAYAGPRRIDLSGMWDFQLDPRNQGEAQHLFEPSDNPGWGKLAVPGSFNEQLAKDAAAPEKTDAMRFYQGFAWYRTSFASPADASMRCFLHLSGIVMRDTVWLNGQKVGSGTRPYLEESYDVTDLLKKDGPNTLVVEVDNTIPAHGIPDTYWHGWWNDGGLIRPVYLELRPATHGESDVATTIGKGGWSLNVRTQVHRTGATDAARVGYSLAAADGTVVWKQEPRPAAFHGAQGELKSTASIAGVRPWSPEQPMLYTLTTSIKSGARSDTTSVRIGFRQIEAKGTQILLNGKPITMRGISRHQFLAGAGMSLTVAEDRKDLEDIKALGANFVRLTHYTQTQDVYDLCDELGLLVWTEIPAWQSNIASLTDPDVWTHDAQPQLQGMVEQHRNHPSVVVWSVANEIPTDKPDGAAYVAKAIAYVKSLDRGRLVTFASDRRETDKAFAAVDVIAINEYLGWYSGKQDDVGPMLDRMHEKFPGKPILVSEFGAEAVAGWDRATAKPDSKDYSYAAESVFLKRHMEQIYAPERRGFMAGGVIWLYNDFPDPHRLGGDHPDIAKYRNNKGIVTMDRTRKPAYEVVKAFFAGVAGQARAAH